MEMEAQKECQICGRKNGVRINFCAVTCAACAAFFRRTMALEVKFDCICHDKNPFGCKACRLNRCFEAGMKRELVRAIEMRSYHMKRQQEMLEKESPTHLQDSLFLFNGKHPFNVRFCKYLMQIGERTSQAWFSTAPLPSKQLDKTLVELLDSHTSILEKREKLTNISVQNFNKSEFLRNIEQNGMPIEWHECPGRSSAIRSTLICISLLMALPAFQSLDLQDQITQIKGAVGIANRLMLPLYSVKLSKEVMMLPAGIAPIETFVAANKFYGKTMLEDLAQKLFVRPMKMFANVGLDNFESILLIHILLCTPAASTGLSKEAQLLLLKESEKFGKMLLQLQQHRFGQQAGALRYMESQHLIWCTIQGTDQFHKLLAHFDGCVQAWNGITMAKPDIINVLIEK